MTPLQQLVKGIELSLAAGDATAITTRIAEVAQEVYNSCDNMLEGSSVKMDEHHYARNLLYKDAQNRFTVIAMTWGPGQGTPLHNHDNKWGVEITCQGAIECTDYSIQPCNETGNWQCTPGDTCTQRPGEVGCILPEEGYHTMINTSAEPALTIHIYEQELTECTIFKPADDGASYQRETLALGYDNL